MVYIDLNSVSKKYGVSLQKLATILFPTAEFKMAGINRLKLNKSNMYLTQAYALAKYLNTTIDSLLKGEEWHGSHSRVNGMLEIRRDQYRVEFGLDNYTYTVYDGQEVIDVFVNDVAGLKLSTFMEIVNAIITKYENDGPNSQN